MKNKTYQSKLFAVLIVSFLMMFLVSCESGKNSIGKPSEIVVVTDTKAQWDGALKDTLTRFFYQFYPGLPQAEPSFTLVNIPKESFIQMFKRNRSILIIEVDEHIGKARIEYKQNQWAEPQVIVNIAGPTTESVLTAFEQNKNRIYEIYSGIEYQRLHQAYKFAEDKKVLSELSAKIGIYLTIPSGFEIATQTDSFIWLRKEINKNSQGIIISQEDYNDESQFNPSNIIYNRNLLTSKNIPGPSDSSYMWTDTLYVKPKFKETMVNNNYVMETRGLWNVVNDFMGGPFVSFTFANQNTAKLITIDAYVYAPGEEKRDLVRELETILNSLEIIKTEQK